MKMKRCISCGKKKRSDSFYRHAGMADGFLNKCKECTKASVKKNRDANIDYYREYDRARANAPHRVSSREAYMQTMAGKISHSEATKRWRERNALARAAHVIFNSAIRAGEVSRPSRCSKCNAECIPHGHHDDYTKPLKVRWLCASCHTLWHKENP